MRDLTQETGSVPAVEWVARSMGPKYADLELFSFHSTSKGVLGECGRRGGYVECSGIDPSVLDQMYKLASIGLCPPVQGQIMVRRRAHIDDGPTLPLTRTSAASPPLNPCARRST